MKARINPNRLCSTRRDGEAMNRMLKIVCAALHQNDGYGHDRLVRVLGEITQLSAESDKDKDDKFWWDIDRLMDKLNLSKILPPEKEN